MSQFSVGKLLSHIADVLPGEPFCIAEKLSIEKISCIRVVSRLSRKKLWIGWGRDGVSQFPIEKNF